MKINNLSVITFPLILPFFLIIMNTHVSGQAAWTSSGPQGGFVNSISYSLSAEGIVYAGTISGVYKSTDGGETWSFAGFGGIEINKVIVDPDNADIVYAGAGNKVGEYFGLYKSSDAGETWTKKYETWVTAIAIDPNNPNTLYISTRNNKILKSLDGGDHWTLKYDIQDDDPVEINSILVDPEDSSNIFISIGNGRWGFLKSTDGGETWAEKRVGPLTPDVAHSLTITPTGHTPQALFAISSTSSQSQSDGQDDVYISADKGETWTALNVPVIGEIEEHYYFAKVKSVGVDLYNPDWIYVGTTHREYPFIAINYQEKIWAPYLSKGLPESAPSCITINPFEPKKVLAGYNDGLLFQSKDRAENWEKSSKGINNSYIKDLVIHPQMPNTAYTVIDGSHPIQKTTDGGETWNDFSPQFPENFSSIAIDPNNPLRMFVGEVGYDYRVTGKGYVSRTEDGGEHWDIVDASMSGTVHDIWIHPTDPDIILTLKEDRYYLNYLYYGGLRRSTDGGDNWIQKFKWGWPNCITSDPNNHDQVYVGLERMGYVYYSPDAGSSWYNISPGNYWYNVNDLAVDSGSNVFAATTEYEENEKDGIWKMEWKSDTSYSWSHVYRFEGIEVTALALDRRTEPATLYAGTSDSGVFISEDGGKSWSEFNNGLEIYNITKLEISATEPKMLYAGTKYGGVWSTVIDTENTSPGKFGGCLVLEQTDDFAMAYNHPELDLGDDTNGDFTLEAWINISSFTPSEIILKPNAYKLYLDTQESQWQSGTGRMLGFSITSGDWSYVLSASQFGGGSLYEPGWHHVAAVYNKSSKQRRLYIDGELASEAESEAEITVNNSEDNLTIGNNFNGKIDEVRISDNVRYQGESFTVANEPFEVDEYTRALWHFDEPEDEIECHDCSKYNNILFLQNDAFVTHSDDIKITETNVNEIKIYPNPFNNAATIEFKVAEACHLQIEILDISGRIAKKISDRWYNSGLHQEEWSGKDSNGNQVSDGIYLVKIHSKENVTIKKLIFQK